MRLRLGRHGILLLGPGLPLRPRDEGPLLPRDRHPVQPPRAGSQVEGYRHRRPGRRVRCCNELAAAAAAEEVVNICCGRVERMSDRVQLRRSARNELQSHTLKETFRCAPFVGDVLRLFFPSREVPCTLSIKLADSESALSGIPLRSKCESGWYYHHRELTLVTCQES
jgi:hypothetical protein